ncbi:MAG TPA: VOC family protein [Acidimicrobiales bacterium]|nr:VOC family protein [Acidimicrobiales bacterium]
MPKGIFHAVVATDDLGGSLHFLTEVCGIGPVQPYSPTPASLASVLGWPPGDYATSGAIVGQPPGMLDLVEIPPSLRGMVTPGVALLAIATPDVEGKAAAAEAAGFSPLSPRTVTDATGSAMTTAPVTVGGVGYELVRFG